MGIYYGASKNHVNIYAEGVDLMKVWVILKNGKPDHAPDHLLGAMIASGEVTSILRSGGWVNVDANSGRKGESGFCYFGPERRALDQRRLCHNCPYCADGQCTKEICPKRYIRFSSYTRE